jgi:hypothetical protein
MKTVITLVIDHERPIAALPELVAGRAWTIDGVKSADVINIKQAPSPREPAPASLQFHHPDEISQRWAEVL